MISYFCQGQRNHLIIQSVHQIYIVERKAQILVQVGFYGEIYTQNVVAPQGRACSSSKF